MKLLRICISSLALVAVITLSAVGYFYYTSLKESALKENSREAEDITESIARHIDGEIAEHQRSAGILAGLHAIQRSLLSDGAGEHDEANSVLALFNNALGVHVSFLLDADGTVTASSDSNKPANLIGNNFSTVPFFQRSISGDSSIYSSIDDLSGNRALFISHPVYGEIREEPAGVVVIKTVIEDTHSHMLSKYKGIVLVTDSNGFIFASNRDAWLYNFLWKVSPEIISDITASQQFGPGPWKSIGMERRDERIAIDRTGKEFHVHQRPLANNSGWSIIHLHDGDELSNKVAGPLFRTLGPIVVSIGILIIIMIGFLYKAVSDERRERMKLEEKLSRIHPHSGE